MVVMNEAEPHLGIGYAIPAALLMAAVGFGGLYRVGAQFAAGRGGLIGLCSFGTASLVVAGALLFFRDVWLGLMVLGSAIILFLPPIVTALRCRTGHERRGPQHDEGGSSGDSRKR